MQLSATHPPTRVAPASNALGSSGASTRAMDPAAAGSTIQQCPLASSSRHCIVLPSGGIHVDQPPTTKFNTFPLSAPTTYLHPLQILRRPPLLLEIRPRQLGLAPWQHEDGVEAADAVAFVKGQRAAGGQLGRFPVVAGGERPREELRRGVGVRVAVLGGGEAAQVVGCVVAVDGSAVRVSVGVVSRGGLEGGSE